MVKNSDPFSGGVDTVHRIPSWITSARAQTLEDMSFLSGAAVSALSPLMAQDRHDIPQALIRQRMALLAAENCVALIGRPERAANLRDEVGLLRPGETLGPAGRVFDFWRKAVRIGVRRRSGMSGLKNLLPETIMEDVGDVFSLGGGTPVSDAAAVFEAVLAKHPREEVTALVLADMALARALNWPLAVPLLGVGMKRRDIHLTAEPLRMAIHGAVTKAAIQGVRETVDLSRRLTRLQQVVPKLRAKGAEAAVELFLREDAVSAIALTARGTGMSDRAARRLCDRLVDLGGVRELTGRDTFRLYGV